MKWCARTLNKFVNEYVTAMSKRCFVNSFVLFSFFLAVEAFSQNICCDLNNDLYTLLQKDNVYVKIHKTLEDAITSAMKGVRRVNSGFNVIKVSSHGSV